ncbi:MAG: hypothetical protein HY595_04570 [Candidatus Omnitrophica bacterium]|nr:hypothetical protein [Candidatus Omnitrophota bacterium]
MSRPTGAERSFGLSVGTVCALLAGWSLWRGRVVIAEWWLLVASALLVPALSKPSLLRVPHALWWRLSRVLGWINARILLSLVFVAVVTPVGLLMRLRGWDPLRMGRSPQGSGWVPSPDRLRDPRHFERMY